jgi:hypothetical protein
MCREEATMKATLSLAALLLLAAPAAADEPEVSTRANAPGWITIYYQLADPEGVTGFRLKRFDLGEQHTYKTGPAINGSFTDAGLPPDTDFGYQVCAAYDDGSEDCSDWKWERTLAAPDQGGGSVNPVITGVSSTMDSVTVRWGAIGRDINRIIARIEDDRGNHVQLDLGARANGEQTFNGLRPGVRHSVGLKGCYVNWGKTSCPEPWSVVEVATQQTAAPEAPKLPGKPQLKVATTTETTVTLFFFVQVPAVSQQKMVLYRDNQRHAEIPPQSAPNGWKGLYTDTVQAKHWYMVCIESAAPQYKICSDQVVDPVWRQPPLESLDTTRSDKQQALAGLIQPKPIKKLGKANPKLCGQSFAGAWMTQTEQNAIFRLDLAQQGGQVSGTFSHENPVYNGTLSGALNGDTLAFSTAQPNFGTAKGEFRLTSTGCGIVGRFWPDQDPGRAYTWIGKRMQ